MKRFFLLFFFILLLIACEKQRFDDRNPGWVDELIVTMKNDPYYRGSIFMRFTWNDHYIYEVFIPVSSSAYCYVYNMKGIVSIGQKLITRITWNNGPIR